MFPLPLRQDSKRELWMLELAWRPSKLTWHLMDHKFGEQLGETSDRVDAVWNASQCWRVAKGGRNLHIAWLSRKTASFDARTMSQLIAISKPPVSAAPCTHPIMGTRDCWTA